VKDRSNQKDEPSPPPADGRLTGVRAVAHDEDERPSRQDLSYGTTMFNRATVPLPRFLVPRRKRRH
jgi:hypothetical protein